MGAQVACVQVLMFGSHYYHPHHHHHHAQRRCHILSLVCARRGGDQREGEGEGVQGGTERG